MRSLIVAALLTLSVVPAFAGDQDFKLINKTGYQIDEVYLSPATSRRWGHDVMGRGSLEEDSWVNITFNAANDVCKWDMMVKYEDGDKSEWSNLDLCSINTVTLYWDRKNQRTRAVTN